MTIGDFFLKYYFSLISIGKIVLEVIIIFVIVTSLLIFASEKIAKFPYNFYSIETGSMKPELPPGTLIITQRSKDYAVDEIITFKYQDVKKPLTHRIININKDGQYITKGDNNQIDDIHPVPNTDIIGKVVFKKNEIGKIILFMRSVTGVILLFIVPITILLTLNVQGIYNWLKEKVGK